MTNFILDNFVFTPIAESQFDPDAARLTGLEGLLAELGLDALPGMGDMMGFDVTDFTGSAAPDWMDLPGIGAAPGGIGGLEGSGLLDLPFPGDEDPSVEDLTGQGGVSTEAGGGTGTNTGTGTGTGTGEKGSPTNPYTEQESDAWHKTGGWMESETNIYYTDPKAITTTEKLSYHWIPGQNGDKGLFFVWTESTEKEFFDDVLEAAADDFKTEVAKMFKDSVYTPSTSGGTGTGTGTGTGNGTGTGTETGSGESSGEEKPKGDNSETGITTRPDEDTPPMSDDEIEGILETILGGDPTIINPGHPEDAQQDVYIYEDEEEFLDAITRDAPMDPDANRPIFSDETLDVAPDEGMMPWINPGAPEDGFL